MGLYELSEAYGRMNFIGHTVYLICLFFLIAASAALVTRWNAPIALCIDHCPATLEDVRTSGASWVMSLRRKGRAPITRPLHELYLYVETFGFFSFGGLPRARRVGFTTSRTGTVHLSFQTSGSRRDLVMSASLSDPHAF